jgi:hypothetical protein
VRFGFADGGLIEGIGGPATDSNLIRASNCEYVINAAQVKKHRALLDMINSGRAPALARGGGFTPMNQLLSSTFSRKTDASTKNDNRAVNFTVNAADADSFRKSKGQLLGEANMHMQRFGTRNG